VTDAVSIQLTN